MNIVFPYNEDIEQLISKAKKLFHLSMNGEASEKMSSMGYKLNYGVALPRIKEISKEFSTNKLFAECAWWSGCRELMILSTFLLEKDMNKSPFKKEELLKWSSQLFNLELCEQFSKNFLSKISYIDSSEIEKGYEMSCELANELITLQEDRTDLRVALGYINYANIIRQDPKRELSAEKNIYNALETDVYSDSYVICTAISRYLRTKVQQNAEEVQRFIQKLDFSKGNRVQYIYEEVNTELQYGNF